MTAPVPPPSSPLPHPRVENLENLQEFPLSDPLDMLSRLFCKDNSGHLFSYDFNIQISSGFFLDKMALEGGARCLQMLVIFFNFLFFVSMTSLLNMVVSHGSAKYEALYIE